MMTKNTLGSIHDLRKYEEKIRKYTHKIQHEKDSYKKDLYLKKLNHYQEDRMKRLLLGGDVLAFKCGEKYIYSPVTSNKVDDIVINNCISITKDSEGAYLFGTDKVSFNNLNAQKLINTCSKKYLSELAENIAPIIVKTFTTETIKKTKYPQIIQNISTDFFNIEKVLNTIENEISSSQNDSDKKYFAEIKKQFDSDKVVNIIQGPKIEMIKKIYAKVTENIKNELQSIFEGLGEYADILCPNDYTYNFKYNQNNNLLQRNFRESIPYKTTDSDINFLNNENIGTNIYNMEHITFTGGGAKGVIYAGTLLALMTSGNILFLNRFTGTSAGALTACIFACLTPQKQTYNDFINPRDEKNNNRKMLAHHTAAYTQRYWLAAMYIFKQLYNVDFSVLFDASFMDDWKRLGLRSVLSISKNTALIDPAKFFIPWYKNMCKTISVIMGNGLDEYITDDKFFTFEQYFEKTGKTLVIVTSSLENQNSVFNSHESTPKLSVITAVCASMAIPIVFPSSNLDDKFHIDGGFFSNYALDNNDFRDLTGYLVKYDRKQFGQNLEYLSEAPYEILRMLLLFHIKLKKIKKDFNEKCKNQKQKCEEILSKSKIDQITKTLEKYLDVTNFFSTVKESIAELNELQQKENSDKKTTMADIIAQIQKLYDEELKKIGATSIPTFDSTKTLSSAEIEKNIQRFINLEDVIGKVKEFSNSIKADATKSVVDGVTVDEISTSDNSNSIEFIDIVYALRNSPNIIFQEFWRSTEYSESDKNQFFGIESREGYDSGYNLMISTYYAIIKSVEYSIYNISKNIKDDKNVVYETFYKYIEESSVGVETLAKSAANRFGTIIEVAPEYAEHFAKIASTLVFLANPVKYIKKYMKKNYSLVMSATRIVTDPIGYCVDNLLRMFKLDSKILKSIGIVYTAATYLGISQGVLVVSGFSVPIMLFFAAAKVKKAQQYFTNFSSVIDSYYSKVNDKSLHSEYNNLRTIKLNVFDAGTLEFKMENSKKNNLIYESFDKTTKFLVKQLLLQEKTGRYYTNQEPEFINNY
jgi:predicted acylesterase/phospholipase RssA